MRWTLLAASVVIAATLSLPGEAAQPAATAATPAATAGAGDAITFAQYRDWRLDFNQRRQRQLAAQLAAADLPAQEKARLEKIKAYYDRLAGLSEPDRDRLFRARFDKIDTNHDGTIDAAERAAWRDKESAFYLARATSPKPTEAAAR